MFHVFFRMNQETTVSRVGWIQTWLEWKLWSHTESYSPTTPASATPWTVAVAAVAGFLRPCEPQKSGKATSFIENDLRTHAWFFWLKRLCPLIWRWHINLHYWWLLYLLFTICTNNISWPGPKHLSELQSSPTSWPPNNCESKKKWNKWDLLIN